MRVTRAPEPLDPSVDAAFVRAVCATQLGSSTVRAASALAGGSYNTTFRLDLADDSALILRVAPAPEDQRPSERHLMRNEVASIVPLTAVADLMPRLVVADFSHAVVPRDYVIQSFLPGTPATRVIGTWSGDAVAHLWLSLGQILHRIHAEPGEAFGRLIRPTFDSWPAALARTLDLMADGCDTLGLPGDDLRVVAAAALADPALAAVGPPRLLHGDLGPGNVMVDAGDPSRGITGIFDCDRTWWGDPRADITFAYVARLDPAHRAAFWTGYGEPAEPPSPRRELYYLARTLGEARLQHARLGRTRQLRKTYDLIRDVVLRLG